MAPIILFDKSFLQSLSLDESVWFGHFFMPVICPLFYVETLADLEKTVREGRTPEQEVGIIADKFPDLRGSPCVHHASLATHELLGQEVPMDGRIPTPGGRVVERDGRQGVIFDESPEAQAFSRWQRRDFLAVERGIAKGWRAGLQMPNLESVAKNLGRIGIDVSQCKTLRDAREVVQSVVTGRHSPIDRMELAIHFLAVPRILHTTLLERWSVAGYPRLVNYAPYTAHVLTVELFFYVALAARLIGTQRASNRVDIAYLNYLPFCMFFVSSDRLHKRSAPNFLRDDQEFVWGPDLKQDLRRINEHYSALPDEQKERGIMEFAKTPPQLDGSIVRRLRARFLRPGYDDDPQTKPTPHQDERSKRLLDHMKGWQDAPATSRPLRREPEFMSVQRMIRKKKGSWWQLPKDLQDPNSVPVTRSRSLD